LPGAGNGVVRKRHTSEWVVYDGLPGFGKDALPFEGCWDANNSGVKFTRSQQLGIDEEEGLVLDNGSAEKSAKLILFIGRPWSSAEIVEETVGIELVIAQEFE
jgi:hypothetical protein